MYRRSVIALITLVSIVTACGGDDESPSSSSNAVPDTSVAPGIANPASEFCVEQGGTVEIVEEADGQVGYCLLPDGSRVEEWEYFRANSPEGD